MDETPFSPIVPGNVKLEPDDEGNAPQPLVKLLDNDDSSNDEGNDEDEIVVEDVNSDDEKILEEAPLEVKGTAANPS